MTCVGRASWRASSPSASILGILGILSHPIPRGMRGMGRSSCACSGDARTRLPRTPTCAFWRRTFSAPAPLATRPSSPSPTARRTSVCAFASRRRRLFCRRRRARRGARRGSLPRETRSSPLSATNEGGRVAARPRRSSSEKSPSRPCASPGSTPLRASGAARAPGAALRSDFLFRERARNERGKIAMTGNDRRSRFVTRGYRRDAASAPCGGKKKARPPRDAKLARGSPRGRGFVRQVLHGGRGAEQPPRVALGRHAKRVRRRRARQSAGVLQGRERFALGDALPLARLGGERLLARRALLGLALFRSCRRLRAADASARARASRSAASAALIWAPRASASAASRRRARLAEPLAPSARSARLVRRRVRLSRLRRLAPTPPRAAPPRAPSRAASSCSCFLSFHSRSAACPAARAAAAFADALAAAPPRRARSRRPARPASPSPPPSARAPGAHSLLFFSKRCSRSASHRACRTTSARSMPNGARSSAAIAVAAA